MCTVLLPPGDNPIAVNKYIIFGAKCFVIKLAVHSIQNEVTRTIILPVVLYGCETWPLTLMEERRLRMFENRVLRGIFRPKRDEVRGEWGRLHKDKLNNLY